MQLKISLLEERHIQNRKKYLDIVNENSVTILFSGHSYQKSADQDYPFSVNRNFYYLSGINQANVILVLVKGINGVKEYLLIEENDCLPVVIFFFMSFVIHLIHR